MQVPPPLRLERQSAQLVRFNMPRTLPSEERKYYSYLLYEADDSYLNAKKVFPDHFTGDQTITAVIVTPVVHQHILESMLGTHLVPSSEELWDVERRYKVGQYVGKIMKFSWEPQDEGMPSVMFTPASYATHDTAMYEACILSLDSTRTSLRHILYSTQLPPYDYDIEFKVDLICTRGILPQSPGDRSASVHEPASSPHPVE